jgi:hypothetical protein
LQQERITHGEQIAVLVAPQLFGGGEFFFLLRET